MKKGPIRLLLVGALGALVLVLSALPHLPHEQTLRIDLGDSSKITSALTLRWAAGQKGDPSIEDWTGEVTFRYEKNAAPRVVQQETRLADGDYVVEIELITERGVQVKRTNVALAGGTTTMDVSGLAMKP